MNVFHSLLSITIGISICSLLCISQAESEECGIRNNFYKIDNHTYKYQSMIYYWPNSNMKSDKDIVCKIDASKIFGNLLKHRISSIDIRVINPYGNILPYKILRNESEIEDTKIIKASDEFFVKFRIQANRPNQVYTSVVLFNTNKENIGEIEKLSFDFNEPFTIVDSENLDESIGLLDWTGPVDLSKPAALIQMDSIFSDRWKLWYEFAHFAVGNDNKSLIPIPVNPLYLSTLPNTNSTCFNMDDVPRFPLYYIRYYKHTKDPDALIKARIGLETILSYTRDDGTMPYILSPWNGKHHQGENKFDIYHSMRAVSEGMEVFKNDAKFAKRLEIAYAKYRKFVFAHLTKGLFQNTASANGAVIEAIYNRWKLTGSNDDLNDICTLADALCISYAKQQYNDFGEYIPWIVIGFSLAYDASKNRKYIKEAYSCLDTTIIPSLKLDRRYYHSVPDFKASGFGERQNANPLQIWYHTDSLLTMYEVTNDQNLYKIAEWVYGDYYDADRYSKYPTTLISATGSPYTERWGSASAEDALRMISKYIWQLKYPDLFDNMQVNANKSSDFPLHK